MGRAGNPGPEPMSRRSQAVEALVAALANGNKWRAANKDSPK